MRDRLIELIKKADDEYGVVCDRCDKDGYKSYPQYEEFIADRIIANGAILPPCNVGDTVYYRYYGGNRVYEGKVTSFIYNSESGWFGMHYDGGYGTYGKYVFLTREEAEQALKDGDK